MAEAFRQLVLKARARLVQEAEKYLGFLNVKEVKWMVT